MSTLDHTQRASTGGSGRTYSQREVRLKLPYLIGRSLNITFTLLFLVISLLADRAQFHFKKFLNPDGHPTLHGPLRLRLTLEKLGGTFVKFGQILAMRPDLISQPYITELSALLDSVPSFDGHIAAQIVEAELGRPIASLFDEFTLQPIAAASFAQVHRARLKTGEWVAVKVQRPGLDRTVAADMACLKAASIAIDLTGLLNRIKLRPMAEDFIRWTRDELDFLTEATYIERMRCSRIKIEAEYIPKVYWDYSSRRVLATQFLEGVWMSDLLELIENRDEARLDELRRQDHDLPRIARNLFAVTFEQAYHRAIMHGDPHAGNLVVLDQDTIGYVDFGITAQLDQAFLRTQVGIVQAMANEDYEQYFQSVLRFLYPLPESVDYQALRSDIIDEARRWSNNLYNPKIPLVDRGTGKLLMSVLFTARRFELTFSLVALRFYRALLAMEMIVFRLDPNFNYAKALRHCVYRLQVEKTREALQPANQVKAMVQLTLWAQQVPGTVDRFLSQLEFEGQSIWAEVSTAGMVAYRVCYGIAVILILVFVGGGVWRMVSRNAFVDRLNPVALFAGSAVAALLFAFFARRFYISALKRGSRKQRN